MRWEKVCIESLGTDLPERVVTSEEIEAMFPETLQKLGVEPGSLVRIAGVKERRWFDPKELPSTIATRAAWKALNKAGITPDDIDLIINTSIVSDYDEPATATFVGGNLGVPHTCHTYDTSHACLGFVAGMVQAANSIELGQARYVLVVSGENPVHTMLRDIETLKKGEVDMHEFRQIFATLTLGSGGVAMVMSHKDVSRTQHLVRGAITRTATEHNQLCVASFDGGMRADTKGLLVHGAALVVEAWEPALREFGWEKGDIDHFVCHQVSLAHFQRVFEAVGEPLEKAVLTLPFHGNCASASLPLSLAWGEEQGRFDKGDQLCFYAAGSGLGVIIMDVVW